MLRRLLILSALLPGTLLGQTAGSGSSLPSFDVATVKPIRTLGPGHESTDISMNSSGGNFSSKSSLKALIMLAYELKSDAQLEGVPSWVSSEQFAIEAKEDHAVVEAEKNLTREQRGRNMELRVRALLEDRFKLTVKHVTKELPVYELVVAKGGPKLTPTSQDKRQGISIREGRGKITASGIRMSDLVGDLSHKPETGNRLVVDKTGLTGRYDAVLTWTPDDLAAAPSGSAALAAADAGPSLFTALQEQLGLKLQAGKAPVETIVVEHVEHPSEN